MRHKPGDGVVCEYPPCSAPLPKRERKRGSARRFCCLRHQYANRYYNEAKEYIEHEIRKQGCDFISLPKAIEVKRPGSVNARKVKKRAAKQEDEIIEQWRDAL